MKNPGTYLNSNFISGQITGTCCYGCAKREDCPMEAVGRKCSKDHNTCPDCTWWNERGCMCFEIDRTFLKM